MRGLKSLPRKWVIIGLLLGTTAVTGSLWAGQISTSIKVTAGNPTANGQIATVSSVATTPTVVTKEKKKGKETEVTVKKILNVTRHQVINIAPGHENEMSFRFYIMNPQDMDQIFGRAGSAGRETPAVTRALASASLTLSWDWSSRPFCNWR